MIVVTRLNGPQFGVNPDLLQRIDSAPDTILTLIDGSKYIVEESMAEVIDRIHEDRAHLLARAHDIQTTVTSPVGLVPDSRLDAPDADEAEDDAPIAPPVRLRPRRR